MSNLFKKVTSAVAGLAIVFSVVSPIAGVSAAYTSLDAANKLATIGVIVDQSSNPADYRLGDTLTRREHVKIAMNLASCQAVEVVDTCNGSFSVYIRAIIRQTKPMKNLALLFSAISNPTLSVCIAFC